MAIQIKEKKRNVALVTLQDLLDLQNHGKQFSLSKVKTKLFRNGTHTSPLLARGMEFAESRRYLPGDEVRNIDWKVTARTGKTHTKLFTEDHEKQILIAVDMRPNMFFATRGVFKSVQAACLAGNIAWSALKEQNSLGGVVFDGKNHFCSKPVPGKRGILSFLNGLSEKSAVLQEKITSDEMSVFFALLALKQTVIPGSLVFIISDFRNFSSRAKDLLLQISRKADLICCFIYDHFEMELPTSGEYKVTNGNVTKQFSVGHEMTRESYKNLFLKRKEEMAKACRMHHHQLIECSTEDDPLLILKQHFS